MEGDPQARCRGRGIYIHLVNALGEAVAARTRPPPISALTGLTSGRVPGALAAPLSLPLHFFIVAPRAPPWNPVGFVPVFFAAPHRGYHGLSQHPVRMPSPGGVPPSLPRNALLRPAGPLILPVLHA